MRVSYWDTSAIIPCIAFEEEFKHAPDLFMKTNGETRLSSLITLMEIESAIRRKYNQKVISQSERSQIEGRWVKLQSAFQFLPVDIHATRAALHMQKLYALKTCDAIQLGAAFVIQTQGTPLHFISFDKKLSRYASQEGLSIP